MEINPFSGSLIIFGISNFFLVFLKVIVKMVKFSIHIPFISHLNMNWYLKTFGKCLIDFYTVG